MENRYCCEWFEHMAESGNYFWDVYSWRHYEGAENPRGKRVGNCPNCGKNFHYYSQPHDVDEFYKD